MVTVERARLSPAQVEFYRNNGYLTVENVLSQEQLATAQRIVDDLVEQSRSVTANTEAFALEEGHSAETPRLARINAPSKRHPFFGELYRSDAILDVIEPLLGPDIRHQGEKLNMKTAGGGSAVEWHQDIAFYPYTNDDVLAIGVCLDDHTLENGCMLMIPGSHKGPVLDHHQDGYFIGAISPSRGETDLTTAVPVEVGAGGITIHHTRMLHASAPNRSGKSRRLLIYTYAAADAWLLAGDARFVDLDQWNDFMVRGEPTVTPRVIAHDVRMPWPKPPLEDDFQAGRAIFGLQTLAKERSFDDR